MTPEEKDMLRKTLELSQDNNKILRGILVRARWSMFFRLAYWGIIIALAFGAYYFAKPYFDLLVSSYKNITADVDAIKNFTVKIPASIGDMFNK